MNIIKEFFVEMKESYLEVWNDLTILGKIVLYIPIAVSLSFFVIMVLMISPVIYLTERFKIGKIKYLFWKEK